MHDISPETPQTFLETSDAPYCVVMEDDVDINVAKFWSFSWNQFLARVPYDYDVVQLAVICPGTLHVNLHRLRELWETQGSTLEIDRLMDGSVSRTNVRSLKKTLGQRSLHYYILIVVNLYKQMTVTTNERGQQNLFAREPRMYVDQTALEQLWLRNLCRTCRKTEWSYSHVGI